MAIQLMDQAALNEDALVKLRLEYARNAFAHTQDLIRFMDQKAFFVLSAVGLLTTALGISASIMLTLITRDAWHSPPGAIACILSLAYLALAFAVVFTSTSVFIARSHGTTPSGTRQSFISLPSAQTDVRENRDEYLSALSVVDHNDILHDYANASAEIAVIYRLKASRVNAGITRLRYLSVFWAAIIVALIVMVAQS
jgi:hypothetical protein